MAQLDYDGILCFGGVDWWYHNRGHYDIQMMNEFRKSTRVLYVNSIALRSPRRNERHMYGVRIRRKLKSVLRGIKQVEDSLWVYSPVTSPGMRRFLLGRWFLAWQVKSALRRIRIKKPLIWIACPSGVEIVPWIKKAAVIYQRTDRYERFTDDKEGYIQSLDAVCKAEADLTLYCAKSLYEKEKNQCGDALFVDHGIDYGRFRKALSNAEEPADIRPIPHPRVGFIGGVDAHTFNADLFVELAANKPGASFVIVGACSLPVSQFNLPNIYLLGKKPLDEVADYMASCDILIMPWNQNEWIKACNPIKLKEYLAAGKPIVSTPFDELYEYRQWVHIADSAEQFSQAIDDVIHPDGRFVADPNRNTRIQKTLEHQTWSDKASEVLKRLNATRGTTRHA